MKKKSTFIIIISAFLAIAIIAASVFVLGFYLPEKKQKEELARAIEEYYQSKLALYQAENEKYADGEVEVAFLGDSLTDGCDLGKYYPQYITANRGIGGETTHGLQERIKISLYDLKPRVAVILIGGNNLDTMFENYEDMLSDIREQTPDTKIVICSLTAMGRDWAYKNKIATYNNVIIKKLAEKYECEYVDLFTPLFDETEGEIYADYTNDGVHLTHSGYEVLASAITPAIDKALH